MEVLFGDGRWKTRASLRDGRLGADSSQTLMVGIVFVFLSNIVVPQHR